MGFRMVKGDDLMKRFESRCGTPDPAGADGSSSDADALCGEDATERSFSARSVIIATGSTRSLASRTRKSSSAGLPLLTATALFRGKTVASWRGTPPATP